MRNLSLVIVLCLTALYGCAGHGIAIPQQPYSAAAAGAFMRHASSGKDWITMGYDLARTGYNPNENTIGPASFGTLHQIWSAKMGGEIGEPMLATGVTIKGVSRNVLYAALGSGKVVAFNADTGAVIWSKSLALSQYKCGTHNYWFGADAAPTIDRTTHRLYVDDGQNQVHALNLSSGTEQPGWPVRVAPYTHDDFMFGGLSYNPANKTLYAETSSTCDVSPWYGRVAAIDTVHAKILNTFFPTQGKSGGGIWGFGGASIDTATGDVFVAVGNADTKDEMQPQNAYYAEQVVKLSPDVSTVLENNYPKLVGDGDDLDFGATPMLYQPPGCPPMAAAINKDGILYIYDRSSISGGPVQSLQMGISTDNADTVGLPAYDPVTNNVYVEQSSTFGIYKPGVAAFAVQADCTLNPVPVWAANFGADGAKSSDDTLRSPISIANGVVYVSDSVTAQTYAFDAVTGSQLWTYKLSGEGVVGPVVANGKLYVGSLGSTTMTAWAP